MRYVDQVYEKLRGKWAVETMSQLDDATLISLKACAEPHLERHL